MKFTAYILMMLSLSIVFYFAGYHSPLEQLLFGQYQSSDTQAYQPLSPIVIVAAIFIAFAGAAIAVSFLTGFSAMYIIPALLLSTFLVFMVFPTSLLINTAIFPSPDYDLVRIPLLAIFNIFTLLSILNFVRGGT
jgi:hypothetical protein